MVGVAGLFFRRLELDFGVVIFVRDLPRSVSDCGTTESELGIIRRGVWVYSKSPQ